MSDAMPMMACGHQANAKRGDVPCCVICWPRPEAQQKADTTEAARKLEGRTATCGAKCEKRPSLEALEGKLAFFEYRGPGSYYEQTCKRCGRIDTAHPLRGVCLRFEARVGGFETDHYYCGCHGWD